MNDMQLIFGLIGGLLTALGGFGAAWATGRANVKSKQKDVEASPYSVLAERVVYLEQSDAAKAAEIQSLKKSDEEKAEDLRQIREEVAELRQAKTEDRAWITRIVEWLETEGIKIPFAPPTWLPTRKDHQ